MASFVKTIDITEQMFYNNDKYKIGCDINGKGKQ